MKNNRSTFPNKHVGSALNEKNEQINEKVKKNQKFPPADVVGGQFKV